MANALVVFALAVLIDLLFVGSVRATARGARAAAVGWGLALSAAGWAAALIIVPDGNWWLIGPDLFGTAVGIWIALTWFRDDG